MDPITEDTKDETKSEHDPQTQDPTNDAKDDSKQSSGKKAESEEDEQLKGMSPEARREILYLRNQSSGYRGRMKTAEQERDALRAKIEAAEQAKAKEEKRFEDLANQEREKRVQVETQLAEAKSAGIKYRVEHAVGEAARASGLRNSRILSRVDLSSGHVDDDGTVDPEDVTKLVRSIKAEYPELFEDPKSTKSDDARKDGDDRANRDDDRRDARADDRRDRNTARDPERTTNRGEVDWGRLTAEQFAAEEARLIGSVLGRRV